MPPDDPHSTNDPSSPSPSPQSQPPAPPPAAWPPPPPPAAWPPPPTAQGAWPPPPQTGYNPYAQPGVYPTPVNGRQILIYGLLSFVCFGIILGPVAFVQGGKAIAAIDQGQADPSQRGLANAGRICGLIGGALSLLAIVLKVINMTSGAGH